MDGSAGIPDWAAGKFIPAEQVDGPVSSSVASPATAQPQQAAPANEDVSIPAGKTALQWDAQGTPFRENAAPAQQASAGIPDWAAGKFIPAEQIDGPVSSAPAAPSKDPIDTFNKITDAAPIGFASALANVPLGATQAVAGGLHAIGALPDRANVNIPGYGPLDLGYQAGNAGVNQIAAEKDQLVKEQTGNNPIAKGLGIAGQLAGNVAGFGAMGGNAAGYIAPIKAGMAQAAMQPAQDQQQRLINTGIGGAAAGAGKLVGNVLSPQVTSPELQPAMETAAENNIPVYRSQVSNSGPVKAVASWEKDIPGSGAGGKIAAQKAAFNDAVAQTIGQRGNVTPETLADADEAIGNTYKQITSKYDLAADGGFRQDLATIVQDGKSNLVGEKLAAFNQQVKNIQSKIVNQSSNTISKGTGIIPGQTYQNLRSNISGILRGSNSSPQMGKLMGLLDTKMMSGMTPEDASAFGDARSMYRNMMVLEKVVKMAPNEPITPQKLAQAARGSFSDYAYGSTNQLAKLGRLGNVLKDTYPNSGTPMRNQLFDIAKHAVAPAVGAAAGGGVGYHEDGLGGAAAGIAGGALLNRGLATPFLYQKMTSAAAPSTAPAVASGIANSFMNLHRQNDKGSVPSQSNQ